MAESAERLAAALAALPREVRERHVADVALVHLPAHVPPWTPTAIRLTAGDAFTFFAEGRVVLSEEAGLWNGPRMHLWGRVGGKGPLHNGARDTASFEAAHSGELALCSYSGEWGTRDGELATPIDGYAALQGGMDVLVVRWRESARAGVEAFAASVPGEPTFAAERDRLARPIAVPAGWHYLWFLGPADIYESARSEGASVIRARTQDDVGILQYPVDEPLAADSVLHWRWRVDELPSAVREDSLPTHDYLSIAVEFENGQDLTYYWSAALAPETHYRCPLPNWDRRETHLVVRSGSAQLGTWLAEERSLWSDYTRAVGEPPGRITAVWLIAVSVFQKGRGAADFSDVWLSSGGQRRRIL